MKQLCAGGNPDFDFREIAEIKKFQLNKIKNIIKYARGNSLFYRKLYKARKIDPGRVNSFDAFGKLPVITKQDLRDNNWLMPAAPRFSWADISVTSGTTGKPVYLPWTKNDFGSLANITYLLHYTAGIKEKDTVQITYPMGAGMWICGLHNWLGLFKMGSCSLRFGPGYSDAQIENMLALKPTVLIGAPSFMAKLGLLARQKRITEEIKPYKICCSGENILNTDLTKNALGRKLTEIWKGADIRAVYGASEGPICGVECSKNKGYHIPAEYFYFEILDRSADTPVEPGEEGRLVITTLNVEGMPLIRYCLGDITFILENKCPCGRTSPRLGPILGRVDRLTKIKGVLINPDEISNAVSAFEHIDDYYIECFNDRYLMDQLMVCIAGDGRSKAGIEQIKNAIKAKIKSVMRLNLEVIAKPRKDIIKRIEESTLDKPYRKPSKFFDIRNKQQR